MKHIYNYSAAAAAKSLQSCSTLCDPTDGSPLQRIFQTQGSNPRLLHCRQILYH